MQAKKKILVISYENEGCKILSLTKNLRELDYNCLIIEGAESTATEFDQMPRDDYIGIDIPIKRFNKKLKERKLSKDLWKRLSLIEKNKINGRSIRQLLRTSPTFYDDHHSRKPFYNIPNNDQLRLGLALEIIEWYMEIIETFKPDLCICILGNCFLKVLSASMSKYYKYKYCCLSHSRITSYIAPLDRNFVPIKNLEEEKLKYLNVAKKLLKRNKLETITYKKLATKNNYHHKNYDIIFTIKVILKNLKYLFIRILQLLKISIIIKTKKAKRKLDRLETLPNLKFFYSDPIKVFRFFVNRYTRKSLIEIKKNKIFSDEKFVIKEIESGFKYILFTMHVLPESSTLTFSKKYYEEDYIKDISTLLPIGYKLLVKEAREMIGDREIVFYKRMKALGNIVLLNPDTSPQKTLSLVEGVIGISGTSILEGIMGGLPCACIGMPEFKELIREEYQGDSGIQNFISDLSSDKIKYFSEKKVLNYIANICSWGIKWNYNEWRSMANNGSNNDILNSKSNIITSISNFIEKSFNYDF